MHKSQNLAFFFGTKPQLSYHKQTLHPYTSHGIDEANGSSAWDISCGEWTGGLCVSTIILLMINDQGSFSIMWVFVTEYIGDTPF